MARYFRRWLLIWLALSVTSGCSLPEDDHMAPSGARLSVASWVETVAGAVTIEQVATMAASQWRTGSESQNYGYTDRAVWYRITLELPGYPVASPWVLEFANPVLDWLDVYQASGTHEGGWQVVAMGDKMPFADRPLPSRNFAVPVLAGPGARSLVYVRVTSGSSLQLPTRLVSLATLAAGDTRSLIVDAGYIGVMPGCCCSIYCCSRVCASRSISITSPGCSPSAYSCLATTEWLSSISGRREPTGTT